MTRTSQSFSDHVAGPTSVHDDVPPDSPLTTKEGWRRFVGHQVQPPKLLTRKQLTAMSPSERDAYDDARRDYHSDLPLVNTPTIRQVITTSRLLVQLNRGQISARRGVIISGASGTGKTTALTQLGRTHERHIRKRHPYDRHRLPVLYVTVPPAATARMLVVEFARFYGLELGTRANITDVDAVCATAAHTASNWSASTSCTTSTSPPAPAPRSPTSSSTSPNGCRPRSSTPASTSKPRACFAGTRGRQIAGRFSVIPATAFAYGTTEQRDTWHALIATLEGMLRLHDHQPATLVAQAEYLFRRSGGMIGSLSQLVRGAAILAIETGTEQITKELLDVVPVDYAAERASTPRQPRTKPATPAVTPATAPANA